MGQEEEFPLAASKGSCLSGSSESDWHLCVCVCVCDAEGCTSDLWRLIRFGSGIPQMPAVLLVSPV